MAKSKRSSNNNNNHEEQDDLNEGRDKPKFQAVVLADPFDTSRLDPLRVDDLRVNNRPLLDYSMDCLVANGVDEAFVVCTSDSQELVLNHWLTKHVTASSENKAKGSDFIQVTCIKDTSLTNAGDALRELYKRNVIQEDSKHPFLLMFGDTVTNMNVRQVIVEHQQRKKDDNYAIMTLILKQMVQDRSQVVSSRNDDLMIAIDPSKQNRVLVYDNTSSTSKLCTPSMVDGVFNDSGGNDEDSDDDSDDEDEDDYDGMMTLTLPCSFVQKHTSIEISTNYIDTGIAICSPDVLARFEDEFDALNIASDFVSRSVAEEEEGLQSRIHAYVCRNDEYSARVLDLATYHQISMDVLQRWCYPVVPDNYDDGIDSTANKLCGHPYLYKKETSSWARSSTVTGPGMLGNSTKIDENCIVEKTVIGNTCTIGTDCTIVDSHIWDDVTIGTGVHLDSSIVAHGAAIRDDAVIGKGCVIGEGCVVGAGVTLPPYTRITLIVEDDGFSDDEDDDGDWSDDGDDDDDGNPKASVKGSSSETDPTIVGPDGKGHVWKPEKHAYKVRLESMGYNRLKLRKLRQDQQMAEDNKEDEFSVGGGMDGLEDDEEMNKAFSAYTEGAVTFEDKPSSTLPSSSSSSQPVVFGRQKGVDVVKEMKDICLEFEDQPASGDAPNMDNLAIELNSYKFSQNATYSDCCMASILAVLEKCDITKDTKDGKLVGAFTGKIKIWAPLLTKLSVGRTEEKAIIHGLEHAATTTSNNGMNEKLSSGTAFRFLLQILHDQEVLSEEAILEWAEERKSPDDKTSPATVQLFQLESVQDFLEWLEEEEDDDSDEDESD